MILDFLGGFEIWSFSMEILHDGRAFLDALRSPTHLDIGVG